jgi:hypothetical protein
MAYFPRGRRAAAALLAVATLAAGCGGTDWTEYRSDAGNYRIEFPGGTPTEQRKTDGEHAVRIAHLSVDRTTAYGVAWYDIAAPDKPAAEILKESQEKTLRSLGAGIESAKAITLGDTPDGAPGRAFTARTASGLHISIRFYAVGKAPMRIYQLIAAVPDLGRADAEIGHFMESFKLLR